MHINFSRVTCKQGGSLWREHFWHQNKVRIILKWILTKSGVSMRTAFVLSWVVMKRRFHKKWGISWLDALLINAPTVWSYLIVLSLLPHLSFCLALSLVSIILFEFFNSCFFCCFSFHFSFIIFFSLQSFVLSYLLSSDLRSLCVSSFQKAVVQT